MQLIKTSFIIFLFIAFTSAFGQTGPVDGSVPSGVIVTTDDYSKDAPVTSGKFKLFNKFLENIPTVAPSALERDNFILDPLYANSKVSSTLDSLIVFESFEGIPQGNSIPPDPYIAVGPNHVIQTVNSTFRITDKEGNTLKTISADQWFSNTVPGAYNESTFDPKVIYDHFANRWVMVWLDSQSSTAYFLISVSDDDDPLGTWFNWALPSNVNGTTPTGSWGDYQGVGYDDQAVYITSNQFYFSGGYQYAKLRILDKNDLYAATAGQLNFRDFYNIADFGLRPSRSYDAASGEYYLLASRWTSSSINTVSLYKLNDPLGTATLSKINVTCNFYSPPPETNQLGGGSPAIDDGSVYIRNEPVYRDGILHAVHAVRNGVTTDKSAVRYIAIDPTTNTTVIDFAMGTPEHYHNYPALAVAKNNDVILTYSRSADDEYMGAYYTILKAGASSPLGSITLQEGKANYVKTFSGTRNRWGDYMGAWTDPADENSFWIYTEYVSAPNTWADWVGGIRIVPYDNAYVFSDLKSVEFGDIELSTTSNITFNVRNYGASNLTITSIQNNNSAYTLLTNVNLPITLSSYDSLTLEYQFAPIDAGSNTDSIFISSNDPDDAIKYIPINGFGYSIAQVEAGKLYGFNNTPSGKLVSIDKNTATPTEIGTSQIDLPYSLTVSPLTKQLYTLTDENGKSKLYRVSASAGDAFLSSELPSTFDAVAFASDNTLYGISEDQKLYSINPNDGAVSFIADVGIKVAGLAINRVDDQMWASVDASTDRDRIYKIDKTNGDTTLVGKTGKNRITETLAFDSEGNLFATSKTLSSFLHSIDMTTGEATDIGSITGYIRILGLVFSPDPVTSVEGDENITPTEFALNQNYPNPFNPSTKITFSLPVTSEVRLSIVDLLGQEIAILKNEVMNAGTHTVDWNISSQNTSTMSSGVYFYRIKAVGNNGKEFNSTMKMMLLK